MSDFKNQSNTTGWKPNLQLMKSKIDGFVKDQNCSKATFNLSDLLDQNFVVSCSGRLTGIACTVDSHKLPSCTSAPILDSNSNPISYIDETQEIFSIGKYGELTYFAIRNKDLTIADQSVSLICISKFTVKSKVIPTSFQAEKVSKISFSPTLDSNQSVSISSILLKTSIDGLSTDLFVVPQAPYLTQYMIHSYTYTTIYQIASNLILLPYQPTSFDIMVDQKFHTTESLLSVSNSYKNQIVLSGIYETSDYPVKRSKRVMEYFQTDINGKYQGQKVEEYSITDEGSDTNAVVLISKDYDPINNLQMNLLRNISSQENNPKLYDYKVQILDELGNIKAELSEPLKGVSYELSARIAFSDLGQLVTMLYRVKIDSSSIDYSDILFV